MTYARMSPRDRLIKLAAAAESRTKYSVRHKCFLSYAGADLDEVGTFVETFGAAFIPRVIGVSESDPFIDSEDDDYIIDRIREKYLWDSTVTIVLIGSCTWSRRFVDWEIYSSLRSGKVNRRNGLLAIQLPSVDGGRPTLPARLSENLKNGKEDGYARYWRYPTNETDLRNWIDDAYDARTSRQDLIKPAKPRRQRNSACEQ